MLLEKLLSLSKIFYSDVRHCMFEIVERLVVVNIDLCLDVLQYTVFGT